MWVFYCHVGYGKPCEVINTLHFFLRKKAIKRDISLKCILKISFTCGISGCLGNNNPQHRCGPEESQELVSTSLGASPSRTTGVCVCSYNMRYLSSPTFHTESKARPLLLLYTIEIRRGNWRETWVELKMLPFCQ